MEKMKTSSGVEHGLMESFSNSSPGPGFANMTEKNKKMMMEKKKRDLQVIKVRYQNLRNQKTGRFEGTYCEYAGEPILKWCLLHNHVYEIPRGLKNQINEMAGTPMRSGLIDPNGRELESDEAPVKEHQIIIEEAA